MGRLGRRLGPSPGSRGSSALPVLEFSVFHPVQVLPVVEDTLQLVLAGVFEGGAGPGHEIPHHPRHDDLAGARHRAHPCPDVNRETVGLLVPPFCPGGGKRNTVRTTRPVRVCGWMAAIEVGSYLAAQTCATGRQNMRR